MSKFSVSVEAGDGQGPKRRYLFVVDGSKALCGAKLWRTRKPLNCMGKYLHTARNSLQNSAYERSPTASKLRRTPVI